MCGEIKLHLISCPVDVSGSFIQQDLMLCIVTVGLQAEQCKLVSYCTEIAINAFSLCIHKNYIRAMLLMLQNQTLKSEVLLDVRLPV